VDRREAAVSAREAGVHVHNLGARARIGQSAHADLQMQMVG
jgi:hypothetical protein